ncbi:MAG: tetratricopeptide repeat protein [Alphaproteobacteria bacterium]|nr:tetratricopeptide repeat protein [Alphaproteobacteria bacterium]
MEPLGGDWEDELDSFDSGGADSGFLEDFEEDLILEDSVSHAPKGKTKTARGRTKSGGGRGGVLAVLAAVVVILLGGGYFFFGDMLSPKPPAAGGPPIPASDSFAEAIPETTPSDVSQIAVTDTVDSFGLPQPTVNENSLNPPPGGLVAPKKKEGSSAIAPGTWAPDTDPDGPSWSPATQDPTEDSPIGTWPETQEPLVAAQGNAETWQDPAAPVSVPEPVWVEETSSTATPVPVADTYSSPSLPAPENNWTPPAAVVAPPPVSAVVPAQPVPVAPRQAADVYYEQGANVPQSSLGASIGPRSADPAQEKAQKYVIVHRARDADDQESLLVSANRALKLERNDAALEMFDRLYDKNPRDPRILMGRALALQKVGRLDSAVSMYETLLDIDPDNAEATVNMLGIIRAQYPSVALRRLLDLLDAHPDNAGIAAQIGLTYADMGNLPDAFRYLGMAASLDPRDPRHVFNMAILSERSGNWREAITHYEKALELDAVYGKGGRIPRETIYDRLSVLRRK